MKLCDKISMAFKDVINRKLRTFLTILAISIGSLLLVVMMGIGDGIMKQAHTLINSFGNVNQITISPAGTQMSGMGMGGGNGRQEMSADNKSDTKDTSVKGKTIKDEDIEKISKIKGIDKVMATIQSSVTSTKIDNGEYSNQSVNVVGVNTKYYSDFSKDITHGNGKLSGDSDIIVGEKYLKKMNITDYKSVIGKQIVVKVEYPEINGIVAKAPLEITGTIVGVLGNDSSFISDIIMSSTKAEPILNFVTGDNSYINNNGYTSLVAYAQKGADVGKVSSKITKLTGFATMSLDLLNNMIDSMTTVIKAILSVAGIIVLIVAALGLVNTMTMTLQEKRKMIGVMRSVGASRGKIRTIFIFQSLILGIGGSILGGGLAALGIYVINKFALADSTFRISLTANNVIMATILTLVIALIAGLIPSSKAAKLNVVEAVAEE